VLSILKTVIDEVTKNSETSKMFVDSLPFAGHGIELATVGYAYGEHYNTKIGSKRYFQGLNYTLTVCLNESLDLRVQIESDTMCKLVFSKILNKSNYEETFEEVDELITQFMRDCGISKELNDLCG